MGTHIQGHTPHISSGDQEGVFPTRQASNRAQRLPQHPANFCVHTGIQVASRSFEGGTQWDFKEPVSCHSQFSIYRHQLPGPHPPSPLLPSSDTLRQEKGAGTKCPHGRESGAVLAALASKGSGCPELDAVRGKDFLIIGEVIKQEFVEGSGAHLQPRLKSSSTL